MESVSVSRAGPEDLDALVSSVAGLFEEDAGRHDPARDLQWPAQEGKSYYSGLLTDPACLLALARVDGRVAGHLVGKLREPDSAFRARLAILESMRVVPELRGCGVGSALVSEFFSWARQYQVEQAQVSAFAVTTAHNASTPGTASSRTR